MAAKHEVNPSCTCYPCSASRRLTQLTQHFSAQKNPSFILKAVKNVAIEDRPIPTLKNPSDVLIRVGVTGICGSDVSQVQALPQSSRLSTHRNTTTTTI